MEIPHSYPVLHGQTVFPFGKQTHDPGTALDTNVPQTASD